MTDRCSLEAPMRVLATASSWDPTSIPPLLALFNAPDACASHAPQGMTPSNGYALLWI